MDEPRIDSLQGAARLTDWGVIRAQGSDAGSFLHGQLTQDVQNLGAHSVRLAGYCSAKGRLLASLIVWRAGTDEIHLACSADVLPATLKRLYKNKAAYVKAVETRLTQLEKAGWSLPVYRSMILGDAASVSF